MSHNANCSKDRSQLFSNRSNFTLDESVGNAIASWCKDDEGYSNEEIENMIGAC